MTDDTEKNILISIKIAVEAAMLAHAGQTRKYSNTPYSAHLARVSILAATYGRNWRHICIIVAWMHDMIEDCGVTGYNLFVDALRQMPLSDREKTMIQQMVYALTKDNTITPRAAKWQDAINKVTDANVPTEAVLLKMCDRIDNLSDLEGFKPGFIRMYVKETYQLIEAVRKTSHLNGYDRAFDLLVKVNNDLAGRYGV